MSYLTGRMLGHVVVTEFRSFETSAAYTYKNTRISLENSKIKCGMIFVQYVFMCDFMNVCSITRTTYSGLKSEKSVVGVAVMLSGVDDNLKKESKLQLT